MSLIAWYPLNGDMKNYGVGDMDLTVTTSPSYVEGKVGKALSSGAGNWTAEQTASIFNNNELSICFWIKPTQSDGTCNLFGNESPRYFSLFLYPTMNDLHWSWTTSDGGSYTGSVITGCFPTGEWTHCVVTYENPTAKFYINGELKTTQNYAYNISDFAVATNVIHNVPYRYLNDLRIYDHCLSLKEISEIAKCKILHYPMNEVDGVIGGRNLLLGSNFSSVNGNYAFSFDINELNKHLGEPITISVEYEAVNWKGSRFGVEPSFISNSGTHYCGVWKSTECNGKGRLVATHYLPTTTITAMGQHYVYVQDTTSGSVTLSRPKWEFGTKATPYTPAPEDSPSFAFDNTIYDVSGYGNHGTVTTSTCPTWSSDAVIGSGSYDMGGTKNIKSSLTMSLPQLSCSFWIKPSSLDGEYAIIASNYDNPASGFWLTSNCEGSGLWFYDGGYCDGSFTLTNGEWYHGCFVFDEGQAKLYLNGELKCSDTVRHTAISLSNLTVGNSYSGSSWNTKQYGQLNDFRIYATALSDSDIKELYQTRHQVDNNGSLFTNEIVEVGSNLTEDGNGELVEVELNDALSTQMLSNGNLTTTSFYEEDGKFRLGDGFIKANVIYEK